MFLHADGELKTILPITVIRSIRWTNRPNRWWLYRMRQESGLLKFSPFSQQPFGIL